MDTWGWRISSDIDSGGGGRCSRVKRTDVISDDASATTTIDLIRINNDADKIGDGSI